MKHHQSAKTHCPHGHEYNEENTRWYEYPGRNGLKQRVCIACTKIRAKKHRLKSYGISLEDWEKMYDAQGGLCAICRYNRARDVDHSHLTKKVRALLCNPCNQGIGLFDENVDRLHAAVRYLEGTH